MTASTFKTYKMHGRDFVNVITKYRELYEQLDKETDDMVYGLHNLTDAEIKDVES